MADGNEALSVDQLSSVMSVANTSDYGFVKVMTDEQLDAYMNGGSGADNDDIPLEDGIYIVTVQQAIKYLDKISGSGGGSTDSDDVVLYEGTASWSGDYYDIAGPMNDPTEFSGFTVEFSSGMTVEFGQVEQSGSSSQWTAYDDAGEYILIIVGIPGNFMFAAGGAHVPNPSTVYKLIGHK